MKILFLTRRFYPDIGGVEKHILVLSKKLIDKGHTVTIVSENNFKTRSKQNNNKSATLTGLPAGLKSYKIPISVSEKKKKWIIWKWLYLHQSLIDEADIIHCHDVFFWYIPFRFLFPRKKVFITFHGYESFPITRKSIIVRKISELMSHGNICIGDFISRWYGTVPTIVSYGAVELSKKSPVSRSDKSAVFIGRLDDQTGIDMYTAAFSVIKKEYPDFRFTVVGSGPYESKLAKEIIPKPFEIGAEKYFSEGRYAFVSRYLSILEAMAAKKLVIAVYDNPIKKDYLSLSPMSKFMVIAGSAEEVVEAVTYYVNHPDIEKEYIEKAYTWVKQQSWEKMAENYISLWGKIR